MALPNNDAISQLLGEKNNSAHETNNFPEVVLGVNNSSLPPIRVKDEIIHGSWMKNIPGSTKLNQINIPGSHDSCAYDMSKPVARFAQCQSHSIKEQLEDGVRIFDVRLFWDEKTHDIYCCHGKGLLRCDCHKKFSKELISYDFVLDTIIRFLKEHSSETIIVSPKHESGNKKLTIAIINSEHEKLKKMGLIYIANKVPTLDKVRGKIVLWDKMGKLKWGMKIRTDSKIFFIKEKYAGVSWTIQKKFKVKPQEKVVILKKSWGEAEDVYENSPNENYGFIHYTSGFDTDFYFSPNPKIVADMVNPFLLNYNFRPGCLYGWFIGDFVDAEYAQKIFLSNFL
ncbi:MAG: phosphatidylinositol-specific phospholipase C domain-containing protein [Cytophagales bacterium]|jgi:1-phosphatidylinositol phosphodiesterase|nr:phosphatidylinositol-specific phospholipase C domain-containing protein [Cytophagales bacterium]